MSNENPPIADEDEKYLIIFDCRDPFGPIMLLLTVTVAGLLYWNVRSKKGETPKEPPAALVQKKSK